MQALRNLLKVLASQIPAFGVAFAWWTGVLKNPIVIAVLAVLFEVIGIIWAVLGKDVWEKLKSELVETTAGWVKMTGLNLFSRFRRRYNKQIIYEHRVFKVRGLQTKGAYTLEVERVFVELHIAPSNPLQASADPISFKELSGSQPVWKFLRSVKKQEATPLVILGPPGCGKTTLLQHIALTFAANRQWRYWLRAYTPLLLFLREHVKTIIEDSPSLAKLAQQYFSDQQRYPELKPPPEWFSRQLKKGKCLVLLDGLDEVVDAEQRQTISAWVDRQIHTYPRCSFVLTARKQGYLGAPLKWASVLEVLLFNPQQVEQFIHNWYLANKIASFGGKNDRGVRQDAVRESKDLVRRLRERPRLEKLTVNPLLLTMIANVHNFRGVLPERRVELYEEICNVLLRHWQEAKGVTDRLTAKQKRVVLQPLAEEMMIRKAREILAQDALTVMIPYLKQVGVAEDDIPSFLEALQASSGLLLEKEAEVWGFAHLTFQEYLCAAHWQETGKTTQWEREQWQSFIDDGWWHEVLRLYGAQSDATSLVGACLQRNTVTALTLAQNIADEALKLENREALTETITNALKARPVIQLRSKPLTVSKKEFRKVFELDEGQRPLEYIQNDYEDQGEVVVDHATGLMWQKSDSGKELTYTQAEEYVKTLNSQKFAGYENWRLPTVSELMSLLEPEEQSNGLYMSPVFGVKEKYYWCWSANRLPKGEGGASGAAWLVHFDVGLVRGDGVVTLHYSVRCVRSRPMS